MYVAGCVETCTSYLMRVKALALFQIVRLVDRQSYNKDKGNKRR